MYMDNFRKPIIVPKIQMLACQYQIFETKKTKSIKESMHFLCVWKERLNTIILSGQNQGDAVREILVSWWEYDELKILESLRFRWFS